MAIPKLKAQGKWGFWEGGAPSEVQRANPEEGGVRKEKSFEKGMISHVSAAKRLVG